MARTKATRMTGLSLRKQPALDSHTSRCRLVSAAPLWLCGGYLCWRLFCSRSLWRLHGRHYNDTHILRQFRNRHSVVFFALVICAISLFTVAMLESFWIVGNVDRKSARNFPAESRDAVMPTKFVGISGDAPDVQISKDLPLYIIDARVGQCHILGGRCFFWAEDKWNARRAGRFNEKKSVRQWVSRKLENNLSFNLRRGVPAVFPAWDYADSARDVVDGNIVQRNVGALTVDEIIVGGSETAKSDQEDGYRNGSVTKNHIESSPSPPYERVLWFASAVTAAVTGYFCGVHA